MNDLIAWIEKAAVLAGRMGNEELQSKLTKLARDAQAYYETPPKPETPQQKEPISNLEKRRAIASVLREASLDPTQRTSNQGE